MLLAAMLLVTTDIGAQSPGSLDETFKSDLPEADYCKVFDLSIQSDGQIVVLGRFFDGTRLLCPVVRLNVDGQLDQTFTNRSSITDPVFPSLWTTNSTESREDLDFSVRYRLARDFDGALLVSGTFDSFQGQPRPGLARLDRTGMLDAHFIPSLPDVSGGLPFHRSVAILPDHRILVADLVPNDFLTLRRLHANGSPDSTFVEQRFGVDWRMHGDPVLAPQPDGKILLVVAGLGLPSQLPGIIRLRSNGEIDEEFAPLEVFATWIGTQPDGKLILAGEHANGKFARMLTDGTLDPSFISQERFGVLRPFAIQSTGRFLAVNSICDGDCDAAIGLQRFNVDGSLDEGFQRGLPRKFFVNALALQPDGKIIVAGQRGQMRRINDDGLPYIWPRTLRRKSDGTIEFQISADTNRLVTVEATTTLGQGDWMAVTNFPAALQRGWMTVTDPEAARFAHRIFRAMTP